MAESRSRAYARKLDEEYRELRRLGQGPTKEKITADLLECLRLTHSPSAYQLESQANLDSAKRQVEKLSLDNQQKLLWWLMKKLPEALV